MLPEVTIKSHAPVACIVFAGLNACKLTNLPCSLSQRGIMVSDNVWKAARLLQGGVIGRPVASSCHGSAVQLHN